MAILDQIIALNPDESRIEGDPSSWHLEPGYSLDHLRILTGPVCQECLDCDGRVAVETDTHRDRHCEAQWERQCEDYYGGSGVAP